LYKISSELDQQKLTFSPQITVNKKIWNGKVNEGLWRYLENSDFWTNFDFLTPILGKK